MEAKQISAFVPLEEHDKIVADLRQRNAVLAAEVQKLQHERDLARRDADERASIEQSLRAEITEVAADYRESRDEASILANDLLDARSALAEIAMAFAEARSDARAGSERIDVVVGARR